MYGIGDEMIQPTTGHPTNGRSTADLIGEYEGQVFHRAKCFGLVLAHDARPGPIGR